MKSLVFIAALMLTTAAHAWMVPGNPDRYLSVGFGAYPTTLNGDKIETDLPTTDMARVFDGSSELHSEEFTADVRIPLRDNFTLGVEAAHERVANDFSRQGGVYTERITADGYRLGLNCRIYFNQ